MIDGSSLINLAGRIFVVFYFLKAGVNNLYHWNKPLQLIKSKNIPFAHFALSAVIATQLVGSLAVIFNYYALAGAIALIAFTLLANFMICNYWTMEGPQKKTVSLVFYANFAVIGGLLLILSMPHP